MKPEHVPHDIFEAFVRAFIAAKPGEYVIDGDRVAAAIAPVTPPATVAALVEALEAVSVLDLNARSPDDASSGLEQAGIMARAALAAYRGENGR